MTTYKTGNPIGSTDARDLYDNAQNLDNFANGTAASYTDRLGVSRRSLSGIDAAADNVLNGIGYAAPVAYVSGISLTLTSQTVDYNGVIYAPKSSALPFTTSSWVADSAKFRAIQVTDAEYLSYTPAGTGAVATNVQSKLREFVSVKDFGAVGDGVTDDSSEVSFAIASGAKIDGLGLTYKVAAVPDISRVKNAAFKVGSIIYVTPDYLLQETAKITNAKAYAAWPQDKAYVIGNQIRVWINYADSHLDGQIRPALVVSDDGGVSWQEPEFLDETLTGHTVWSAGTDSTNEYVFVRNESTYAVTLYKRTVPSGAGADYYGAWTTSTPTFPLPGFTASVAVMLHSFAAGPAGAIVVGAHNGDGAWLLRSTNQGATWTAHTLLASSDAEEPTVKYDSISGKYYGFLRGGNTGSNPKFWVADSTLSTVGYYTAPNGYFGSAGLQDSPAPLVIVNGVVHAFCSYRSGTLEGNVDDGPTSAYYIRATIANGDNIWNHATTYRLGALYHAETGGASGCGVGSVVRYNDKVFLFYGSEERTGTAPISLSTTTPINRIVNIYQTALPLVSRDGVIDYRDKLVSDRSANNPHMRLPGGMGWKAKEGKWVWSLSHELSSAYATAKANAFGSYIFDLAGSAGGLALSTSGNTVVGYVVLGGSLSGATGIAIDTSNGAVRIQSNGNERVRWDEANSRFRPSTDNDKSLGAPAQRWQYVHAFNVRTHGVTVAGLPAAATAGAGTRAFVTDATATTFASIVAGGGANGVPVYSDGTNWRIG